MFLQEFKLPIRNQTTVTGDRRPVIDFQEGHW